MATLQTPLPGPPASSPRSIGDVLAQVSARLRLARWVRHASRGALGGMALALVAVLLAHLDFLPDALPLEAVIPGVILLGVAIGTITTFLKPIAVMDAARLAEARLGLKERLSSALEFERAPQAVSGSDAQVLRRLQQEDAAAHARSLNVKEAVPLRLPPETKAFAASLLVLLLALILPSLPVFVPPALQMERKVVAKTGAKLGKTARLIQKQAEGQHLEGTRRVALSMQRLAQRLAQGRMDKKQAMVQMSKLTQQMKAEQQKMAERNSGAAFGAKSMAQAGQQLAQAMQAGQGSPGANGKPSGSGQKASGGGPKNQKNGQPGGANSKTPAGDKFSGFNIPGAGKNSKSSPGQIGSNTPSTPEIQKAAQAMQQNDAQGLSQQLRQMASRAESGKMSPSEQQQAGADLQKLATALKDTPMPETQKHTQAASDAMKRGDKAGAASEMRKAADAAEREAHEQADEQAMSDAQQATEGQESEMAGANSPGDIQDDSTQPGQGQGKGQGKGSGQGDGEGEGEGDGSGLGNSGQGKHGSGKGNGGSGGGGEAGGKPGDTGNGSSPVKHLGKLGKDSAKTARLYFGKPLNSGPSKTGPTRKVRSNPNATPGQTTSGVPYYDYVAPAKKSAESTMDKEDIPPAYRTDVRKYFNSLNPPAGGGGH